MSKIAVISDVNAGLDYVKLDFEIPVLRSVINFGDEHYIDGKEIMADEFYAKIQNSDIIPSTSAPTIGEAMDLLDELVKEGYTDVIMYSISYELSSIGQMVETLKDEYSSRIKIHVVNTKTATYLQGYIAVRAKEMALKDSSVEDILKYSYYLIENMHAYFIVDSLKYLVKNGRLSGVSGFIGELLKIKPVLEINKEGKIVSKEKIKTYRKAIERALELFLSEIQGKKKVKILVFHTVREEDAKKMKEHLEKICPNAVDVEINMITPAVGAHIGCGILGFGYFILEH